MGSIIALAGLGLTILSFAVAYGMLKQKVERNTKDIAQLNTFYGNIYSMLTDIRVQIAAISTKIDLSDKKD